jgi:L-ribulose-5-phosphate 4-epimerase
MLPMSQHVKQRLIEAGLILGDADLGDFTRGHVSIRDPENPSLFFMKPHSLGFEEITMENIVICNLDGEKVGGGGRRHSEVFIHSEIYKARPDLNSVIHSHPKYATIWCSSERPWKIVSQACVAFSDGLGYYQDTVNLIRSPETGRGVAQGLAGHKVVMMRGHGVTVTGISVEEAVIRTLTLENACHDQVLCLAMGGEIVEFAAGDIASLTANLDGRDQYVVNFDYLARKAKRRLS